MNDKDFKKLVESVNQMGAIMHGDSIPHRRTTNNMMNKKLIKMDGYDDCIVGVVERAGQEPILCYDKEKVLCKLESQGMNRDEAEEFFYYNQIGTCMGDSTPCFLSKELDKDELLSQSLEIKEIEQ